MRRRDFLGLAAGASVAPLTGRAWGGGSPGGPERPGRGGAGAARPLPQTRRGGRGVPTLPLGPAAANALAIDAPEVAGAFDRLYAGDDPISRGWRDGRAARSELIATMPAPEPPSENGAP